MIPTVLLALGLHCLLLSLLAIGGALAIAPEMHRWLVSDAALLSEAQFTSAIAIAQAVPGPNLLFVPLLGYQLAGLSGAVVALASILSPSSALALLATRWGHARRDWRAVRAFKAGMAPITLALIAATGWLLASPSGPWPTVGLTLMTAVLAWRTRIHLLWLIGVGAVLGALGWV